MRKKFKGIKDILLIRLLAAVGFMIWLFPVTAAAREKMPEVGFRPFAEARALSSEQNKPIFIFFWSEDCYYCRKFTKEVLTVPQVAQLLNDHYIPVSVDLHNDEEKLGRAFKVRAVPNLWFLAPDGQVLTNVPGFVPAELFEPILEFFQTGAYLKMDFDAFMSQREPLRK